MFIPGSVIDLYSQTQFRRQAAHVGLAYRWDTPMTESCARPYCDVVVWFAPLPGSDEWAEKFRYLGDTEPMQPIDEDAASV